uniref:adhesion G protein-coupled receptor L4-like n=1 Tax=Styela clava TaxID=7725 RepID=UPI0019398D64|nr:adhesion G protein-coupled receptor L4-like [Styela clava]
MSLSKKPPLYYFGFISIWTLLLLGVNGQLRVCRNRTADVYDVTFTLSTDVHVEITGPKSLQLYADVAWVASIPNNVQLDGFAVHLLDTETKRNHSITSHSIEPVSACHSGENHMWISTTETSVCDTNDTIPECAKQLLTQENTNVCLCPQPECGLFYPVQCKSTTDLLGPDNNYHLTVLPTTSNLSFPINFDTEYEFSISPYYREFANLSPYTTIIHEISTCHPAVLEAIGQSAIGSSCMEITWTPVPDVLEYLVEVSIGPANVTNIITSLTTSDATAKICGLNVCVSYTVTVSYFIGEVKNVLQEPSTHVIPLILPTPDETTTSSETTAPPTSSPTTTGSTCTETQCAQNGDCQDLGNGNFGCVCVLGYTGDGLTCTDISECDFDIDNCSPFASCFNFAGSYDCQCNAGYFGNGSVCEDVDECQTQNPCTEDNQVCVNTQGFYRCDCEQGYTWNETTCNDVDECQSKNSCAGDQQVCINSQGSYGCACEQGYTWKATFCADVDECADGTHGCDQEAGCTNTEGSYTCTCKSGFSGDGRTCKDVNECVDGTHDCDREANCTNTEGSHTCRCKPGLVGDGKNCRDPLCPAIKDEDVAFCVQECDTSSDCRAGEYCCYNGCGRVCITFQDPRCPTILDGGAVCVDECMDSERTGCSENEICCYNGCGRLCFPVEMEGSCDLQDIDGFTFPASFPGLVSYSEQMCEDTSRPIASVSCVSTSTNSSRFDPDTLVRTDCRETIKDLTSQPYNSSKQVSATLQHLQVLSSNVDGINQEDVGDITKYFEGISKAGLQFSNTDIGNVAEITSHMSEYFALSGQQETSETTYQKQSLVQSLTTLSRKLEADATSGFTAISKDINIKVQDVPDAESLSTSITFIPDFYSGSSDGRIVSPIEIKIPGEAFAKAAAAVASSSPRSKRATSSVRIVSVGYRNSTFFPSSRDTDWVIASSLGDKESSLSNIRLIDPVVITNREVDEKPEKVQRDEFKTDITNLECVFWDFDKQWWSRDGCCLIPGDPPECHCNHLTNFALLVSKDEIGSNIAITIVTYVGCGLSAICLICTVLVVGFSKRLRRKQPMQVIMNICGCLAVSFLLFMFGVDAANDEIRCSILAALLHYALLAAWFWMAIYSHTVYRDVVKVMETRGQRYNMFAAAVVAYGIPALIVALNAGITLGHIDKQYTTYACDGGDPFIDSSYNARNFCWLQNNSLYFGFLLPVGLLLVYNIVVYCIVIPKITCFKKQVGSSASPKSTKRNVTISLVMATTVGLSWVIGYFMLLSDNQTYLQVMSWLFAVANAFQGVFIFVFTIVRTGEIQKLFCTKRNKFNTERNKTASTTSTGLSPMPSPLPKDI